MGERDKEPMSQGDKEGDEKQDRRDDRKHKQIEGEPRDQSRGDRECEGHDQFSFQQTVAVTSGTIRKQGVNIRRRL